MEPKRFKNYDSSNEKNIFSTKETFSEDIERFTWMERYLIELCVSFQNNFLDYSIAQNTNLKK
jgi:hypothetical protein